MATRLSVETTLTGEALAKALSATAIELGVADAVMHRLQKAVLTPLPDPPEGPWPDARMQAIEDWVTGHAEAAVQEWVDGQVRWVHLNWTPEPSQLPPTTRMHAPWWMLALGLVALPVLVQQGASWRVATDWVEGVAPGTLPRWPATPHPMPRALTPKILRPVLEDIVARMERWSDTVMDTTRTVWTQGRRLGHTAKDVQKGLREHFTDWSQDFGRLVRTEVAAGWHNATLATTDALYGTVRVHPDACPECHRLLEGQRFRLFKHVPEDRAAWEHTAFWPDKWLLNWDRKPKDWVPAIPQHPQCLPGSARVSAKGIAAASKRWYDGQLVVILTASGKQLASTPNHPILTPQGWVASGLLKEGDEVISSASVEWMPAGDDDHDHMPSRIEEIAETVLGAREVLAREVPVAPEDFHGDGKGSEVAIIGAYGLLADNRNGMGLHGALDRLLKIRCMERLLLDGLRMLNTCGEALGASTGRIMRGFRERFAFVGRELLHADAISGATISDGHVVFQQASADYAASHSERPGQRQLRFSTLVTAYEFIHRQFLSARGHSFRTTPKSEPVGLQDGGNGRGVATELASQILAGATGEIFADKVVRVEVQPFWGHVYNLQTATGHYVANGIVTHNCRCLLEPEKESRRKG